MVRILVTFDYETETGRGWYEVVLGQCWVISWMWLTRLALARLDPLVTIIELIDFS